ITLGSLLEGVERDLAPRLAQQHVTLDVRADGTRQLALSADPLALRQAIENVVLNGARAAGSGGVVTLRAASGEGMATLRISDTGPGVDASIKHRIFEPFFTTKSFGGGA